MKYTNAKSGLPDISYIFGGSSSKELINVICVETVLIKLKCMKS